MRGHVVVCVPQGSGRDLLGLIVAELGLRVTTVDFENWLAGVVVSSPDIIVLDAWSLRDPWAAATAAARCALTSAAVVLIADEEPVGQLAKELRAFQILPMIFTLDELLGSMRSALYTVRHPRRRIHRSQRPTRTTAPLYALSASA